MGLIDRAKNILLTPKTEWPVIAGESPSTGELMGGYVAPLAGISCFAASSAVPSSACPCHSWAPTARPSSPASGWRSFPS